MKIKMRYDNTYQTLEVDAEKMWVSLSLEAGSNISQEEKEQLIQDKVEEIYNKPEYNSWHKLDRHRGEPKRTFRKDDEDADNSDGLDLIPDYSDEERRERKENYEEVCQKLRSLLKPEYADVIISVVLDGNTPEEYASEIGVHRDTVYKRLQRAKKKCASLVNCPIRQFAVAIRQRVTSIFFIRRSFLCMT